MRFEYLNSHEIEQINGGTPSGAPSPHTEAVGISKKTKDGSFEFHYLFGNNGKAPDNAIQNILNAKGLSFKIVYG